MTAAEQMRALAADLSNGPLRNEGLWPTETDAVERAIAALVATAAQLDAVREIVENYGGWYEYSPEDSWRFERDLRKALDMPQYEPED